MTTPVFLDTDVGDDIDDALAIALICASPELELRGVATVWGNAAARARQARTILSVAGDRFATIAVAVGCTRPISTSPYRGLMAQFADPARLPNQDATCLPESSLAPIDSRHGVDALIETILDGDGDVVPIVIGAMTNVALAIVKEPRIVGKIPKLAIMAGEFRQPKAEWNILCDPEAAAIVFASGIAIDLIPWHIGDVVRFDDGELARLFAGTSPLCRRLADATRAWQADRTVGAHAEERPMPRLYDPMVVATLVRPELCAWRTGTVHVELRGERTRAFTTFEERAGGNHRVAWDASRSASIEHFLGRVLGHSCGRASRSPEPLTETPSC